MSGGARAPRSTLVDRLAGALPPASGAVVMGTGIVSFGLALDGRETLSRALLALTALVWFLLGAALLTIVVRLRPFLVAQAASPAAFTGVAGTDVFGARVSLLGWNREAAALLAIGLALWLVLLPYVLAHWTTPTVGVSFILVVGTESLAALGASLAIAFGAAWLAIGSIACAGLGLAFYVGVVSRFDLRQLLVGRGDHWVSGGALAIATLACARLAEAAGEIRSLHPAAGALRTASLGLWSAALLWLPVLLVCEAIAPRPAYDARRWSTVFPLGMYAVCSFTVAKAAGIGGIGDFARVWIWAAFAVWVVVATGLLRRAAAVVRAAV